MVKLCRDKIYDFTVKETILFLVWPWGDLKLLEFLALST